MSPPLIREVKSMINREKTAILDAPPGASCPVINTVMGSDVIMMVTEPTPFGLHDLKIAVEAVRPLSIPLGVVVNRSDIGDDSVKEYCETEGVPVLMEIPHRRDIAEGYSQGRLLVDSAPEFRERFLDLYGALTRMVDNGSSGLR
jgi:MinD superfamily P-loop ATPase